MGAKLAELIPRIGRPLGRTLEAVVGWLPKGPAAWWVSRHVMGLEESSVRLEALNRVLAAEKVARVDLLKVDAEGYELDVLQGLGPEGWAMVQQVVLDTHDQEGQQTKIEALLRENGLTHIRTAPQQAVDTGLTSVVLHASRPS
jgi:hypothetical protein